MSNHPEKIVSYEKDYNFRFRYETLRSLLNKNGSALQILSDLEADLNHMRHYDKRIKRPIQRLITESLLMAQELNLMTEDHYSDLYEVIFQLRNKTDALFLDDQPDSDQPFVVRLDSQALPEPELVGGKAFGIWRFKKYFKDLVPSGFVVTTAAYNRIIKDNNLQNRIRILLNNLDVTEDQSQFKSRTQTIRRMIRETTVSEEIENAIKEQAELLDQEFPGRLWAVRSSAVCEDGKHSFAGQFDSELQIKTEDMVKAYLHVLASRFSDRAVKYRIHNNFSEVDTPMAVLFMPMVDPAAAGVVYTADIKDSDSDAIVISSVPGLANRMVKGEEQADTFLVSKGFPPTITRIIPAAGSNETVTDIDYVGNDKIVEIAEIAGRAVDKFGYELDIEWAVDRNGQVHFLQARQLNIGATDDPAIDKISQRKDTLPIIEGGMTIFPGRAEGPLKFLSPGDDLSGVPDGSVVLVEQPRPELASILPKIAALLVIEGNPVGHLATLVREFSVPCIFRLGENAKILPGKNIISVNATKRTVYAGIRWPGIRERVLARIAAGNRHQKKSGPLYDLVIGLNLLDPDASSFKAKSCKSVHDTLRFMHEMSVRSMFGFGDKQSRAWNKKSKKLLTGLPVKFQLIDLDQSVDKNLKNVAPENVGSVPFKALWRGISDSRLFWPERWEREMRGMPSDFKETVLGGNKGPRRASDKNYAIVARDYMNLNARFAYHYAMVDAMVGPGTEHNHVHFRFRGGGAADENRKRRARFLERVLREFGFGVDRSGDLVTAWFRRYPKKDSENALEFLGRLIVCARQLDATLKSDAAIKLYADYFIKEQFEMFV
ncbi:MAG: PEP-utilizing enzyme [Desulfobacteraceae bacterium]|jgi:pyruvate,water dikinase|nr:PEP-utilizing enzyme [Desulfobacteraceae bacterium]